MVTQQRKDNIIMSFLTVVILTGFFWIIGYSVILITRVFKRPFVFPSMAEGAIVGFASLWCVGSFGVFFDLDSTPTTKQYQNKQPRPNESIYEDGYDCTVENGKVTFAYIPKEPVTICWFGINAETGGELYLVQDKANPKVFHPSSKQDEVKTVDIGNNDDKAIIMVGNRGVELREVKLPVDKADIIVPGFVLTTIIAILGLLALMSAHAKVTQDASTG